MKLNIFFKTGGIVMTEALMAVTLMASAVIITGSIIESAVSTTKQTRDYAIAQNLANEAASAIENIINSNIILYSNRPECWLVYNIEDCSPGKNTPVIDSNYTVSLENGRWTLVDTVSVYDLDIDLNSTNNEVFRLYSQQIKTGDDSFPMYNHSKDQGDVSPYFRSVKVLDIGDTLGEEYILFSVKVQWKDRSVTRTFQNEVTLYKNY